MTGLHLLFISLSFMYLNLHDIILDLFDLSYRQMLCPIHWAIKNELSLCPIRIVIKPLMVMNFEP